MTYKKSDIKKMVESAWSMSDMDFDDFILEVPREIVSRLTKLRLQMQLARLEWGDCEFEVEILDDQ